MVGRKLGVSQDNIACTEINLENLRKKYVSNGLVNFVLQKEKEIFAIKSKPEQFKLLDRFYFYELSKIGYDTLNIIRVIGAKTKITKAREFTKQLNISLKDLIYVGDSITDSKLFQFVNQKGGLSIAVNGNIFALNSARVAVATTDMRTLKPILDAWITGGWNQVKKIIGKRSQKKNNVDYALVDTANSKEFDDLVQIHKKFRVQVRGQAAGLS